MLFPERPITLEHIRTFCRRFKEGYRVEYKSVFDRDVRDQIPKVLSSFANSHGGVLLIGVRSVNGEPKAPFEGFSSPQEELALTIENICLQDIYPPLLPRSTVVQSDVADHVFVVVEVEESAQAPHAIENSTAVYVRTGHATNPYDLATVDSILELAKRRREPLERRSALLARSKQRFNKHIAAKLSTGPFGTILELCAAPRFPERQICNQEDLMPLVQSPEPWKGLLFPDPGSPAISQHESIIVRDAARGTSFFELNVWGQLFYGAHLGVQYTDGIGIPLDAFVGYVLFFVQHAAKTLQSLGWSGLVDIETSLGPIQGLPWLHAWSGCNQALPGSEFDNDVAFLLSTTEEALRQKPDSVAAQIFRQVFFSVNLLDLVKSEEKLNQLILRGYAYNRSYQIRLHSPVTHDRA